MGSCYKQVHNYISTGFNGIVLEIGSDRYEGSSAYFAEIAEQLGTQFITLDLDENMPRRLAQCIPAHLKPITEFIHCDGTEWTKTCKHQISVLYLDNFDWDWEVGALYPPLRGQNPGDQIRRQRHGKRRAQARLRP